MEIFGALPALLGRHAGGQRQQRLGQAADELTVVGIQEGAGDLWRDTEEQGDQHPHYDDSSLIWRQFYCLYAWKWMEDVALGDTCPPKQNLTRNIL